MAGGFPAIAIPARYALERGEWTEAAASPSDPPRSRTWKRSPSLRARSGLRAPVSPMPPRRKSTSSGAARQGDAAKEAYWTTQVEIQRQGAEGWMLWAQGKKAEAIKMMAAAAALEDTTEKSAVTPGPLAPRTNCSATCSSKRGSRRRR